MERPRKPWAGPLSNVLTGGAACFFLALYLGVALARIRFPFELEWMEGAVVDHARRVLSGRPLYAAPSIRFIAFPYTPLYYWLAAASGALFGVGFFSARLVSFLASLGCLAVLFVRGRRDGGSVHAGLLSAGLFAAMFALCGAWYDLARVDTLFLLFLLLAVHFVREARPEPLAPRAAVPALVPAAVFLALAFLAKQTAPVVGAFLALYSLAVHRRGAAVFAGLALALGGLATVALQAATHGWFLYYTLHLASRQPTEARMIAGFWRDDLARPLAPALALIVLALAGRARRGQKAEALFAGLVLGGTIAVSYVGRLTVGGYRNALMPVCAAVALFFGPAVAALRARVALFPRPARVAAELALLAACLVQFGFLAYRPLPLVPTAEDRRAGEAFLATLAAIPGDVLVPNHGYLPSLAGKRTAAHETALHDVLLGDRRDVAAGLRADLQRALDERRWTAVVLDEGYPFTLEAEVRAAYPVRERFCGGGRALYPRTGVLTRPCFIERPGWGSRVSSPPPAPSPGF